MKNSQHKSVRAGILLLGMTLLGLTLSTQPGIAQTTPPPAFGQDPTAPPVTQAPPVTSLDEPSLEPSVSARSYLQPGAHISETVNSNLGGTGGSSGRNGVVGTTRVLGSLDLKRLWSRYDLSLDYIGGLSLYSDNFGGPTQSHSMNAAQRYSWRTGQIQVCDGLTYLPEGSFGFSAYGAGGSCGGSSIGGGGSSFGSLTKTDPRLTNSTGINLHESLSPRSTITLGGSYGFTDFFGNTSVGTVNSHQLGGQAGYNRILNKFDQVGISYGYQQFQFPTAGTGTIKSNVIQALYAHQVSGRMSLILGVGPQFTTINGLTQLNANVRASLRYHFPRTSLAMSYSRFTSSGSGLQLGSQSDVAKVGVQRPLNRLWTGNLDLGYSRHSALQRPGSSRAVGGTFQTGFTGGGVSRRLGHFFTLTMHYQYSYESFSDKARVGPGSFNRHIGDVMLSWHPRPIRLD